MTNSEMEVEKLEVWNGRSQPPYCGTVNEVGLFAFMHIALSMNQDILNERVKVDRCRIEEAFFQYALLRVTLWYPDQLSMSTLPLHNKTMEILPRDSVRLSWSIIL